MKNGPMFTIFILTFVGGLLLQNNLRTRRDLRALQDSCATHHVLKQHIEYCIQSSKADTIVQAEREPSRVDTIYIHEAGEVHIGPNY